MQQPIKTLIANAQFGLSFILFYEIFKEQFNIK